MSQYIISSFENRASTFKRLENFHLSEDFYHNIYSGVNFSRYSIDIERKCCYIYILKHRNSKTLRFKEDIKMLRCYHKSPFLKYKIYEDEMYCYGNRKMYDIFDIVISERAESDNIFLALSQGEVHGKFFSSFVASLIWIIKNNIVISGFTPKDVKLFGGKVKFDFNFRHHITVEKDDNCDEKLTYIQTLLFTLIVCCYKYFNSDITSLEEDEIVDLWSKKGVNSDLQKFISASDENFNMVLDFILNPQNLPKLLDALYEIKEIAKVQLSAVFSKNRELKPNPSLEKYFKILPNTNNENRTVVLDKNCKLYGYVDDFCNLVLPCKYAKAQPFYESIAVVIFAGEAVAIDINGAVLVKDGYNSLVWLHRINRFVAQKDGVVTLLNRAGVEISKKYILIDEFMFGKAVVENGFGKRGYIDIDGKEVTPIIYNQAQTFADGLGSVLFEDKWYKVDSDGKLIDPTSVVD